MPDDTLPKTLNAINPLPSVERLNELLDYDPATGIFRWKVRRGGGAIAGSVAGYLHKRGYRHIRIDGVEYKAHRLAWKIMTRADPMDTIDHINNQPDDNRFSNLREATHSQQCRNTTSREMSSSKFLGVSWQKDREKWRVRIRGNGKLKHIGLFTCEIEAARAYDAAAAEHYGEFANLNFSEAS